MEIDLFTRYDVIFQLFIALNLAFAFIKSDQLNASFSWLLFNKYNFLMEKINIMTPIFESHTELPLDVKNALNKKIKKEKDFITKKEVLSTIYDPFQHISFPVAIFSITFLICNKFFVPEVFYLYMIIISSTIFIEKIWGVILFRRKLSNFMVTEFDTISVVKIKEKLTLHEIRHANCRLKNIFFYINIAIFVVFLSQDILIDNDIISYHYSISKTAQNIALFLAILNLFSHFIYLYLLQLIKGNETETKASLTLNYLKSRKDEIDIQVEKDNSQILNDDEIAIPE